MAKKAYVGVLDKARDVRHIYVGVDDVARRVWRGYIGDENKNPRMFWDTDRVNNFLKLNFEDDSIGTHTYTLADAGLTVRYAIEQYILMNEGSIYPVHIANLKHDMSNIMAWTRRHVPESALCVIEAATGFSSTSVDDVAWPTIQVNVIDSGYSPEVTITSEGIENGYRWLNYNAASATWKRYVIQVRETGTQYPTQYQTVSPNYYNFIGSRGSAPSNSNNMGIVCNLGVYFTEYTVPATAYQNCLLYWDFSLTGTKVDYNRNIYLTSDGNIQEDPNTGAKWLTTVVYLPRWTGQHLFADIEYRIETTGVLSLERTVNQQTGVVTYYDTYLLNYAYGYYFDVVRSQDNKAYGSWRMQYASMTSEEEEWEDHAMPVITFTVSYEGKILGDTVDFNYTPINSANQQIVQIGYNIGTNPKSFSFKVWRITVKRTPINPTDLYFYSKYLLQHSPIDTNIQSNRIISTDPADFVEYFGTNKSFVLAGGTEAENNYIWSIDTRNFGGYARQYIRSPSNNYYSKLYFPIHSIENASGKYIRFSARTYSGTSSFDAGVAYVDGNNLVEESCGVGTLYAQLEKFGGRISSNRVDYIWIEHWGGSGNPTVMVSTIKISDTSEEAFH